MPSKAKHVGPDARTVHHNESKQEFSITLAESQDKCVLLYNKFDLVVDLWHTEVPPQWRGQGLGGDLARAAMDWVKENKWQARLSCTYLQKFVRENPSPGWEGVVVD